MDDWRRLYGAKGNIEPFDLVPVSLIGGAGLGVCGSDCGLDLIGIGLAVTQRLVQQAGRLRDHFHVPERSILLIRFGPESVPEWELVYNIHDSWPDDAKVIRAHDFGERNIELYRYYAERQPDRMVYRFDRETGTFSRLGNVVALAKTLDGEGDSILTTKPADGSAQ